MCELKNINLFGWYFSAGVVVPRKKNNSYWEKEGDVADTYNNTANVDGRTNDWFHACIYMAWVKSQWICNNNMHVSTITNVCIVQ